ncbi:restriction endonuclease subunit S [Moritella yayanosii]|uniref:Putative Restriction endonuclease, type I, HsdS n=1 Tax=Moritella yayanosii TaxID=69539 RepID=A0A330LZJ1_9GAMM|nr:restriction endonuclease subunit S [Moritella yayanosii]SQD79595.1 putative Restriction endonuclease, type I, HsdS [Moritella yayanosii]
MVIERWLSTTLGEIASTVTSGSRDWAKHYSDSGSKFIRMTNLSRNGIYLKLKDMKYVDVKSNSADGKRTSLTHGDILISITAELGKIGWIPQDFGEAYINQHTALVRIKKAEAESKFVAYLLSSDMINRVINLGNDSGAKAGLNLPSVKSVTICLPPRPEQQKIAAILTSVDDVIEKTQAQIDKLKDLKTGMMQELLTRGVGVDGKPHTEFKDSPVGRIPKGWDVVEFSKLILSSNQGVNTTTEKVTYSEYGIPAIRSNNVDENVFDMRNRKYVSYEIFARLSEKVKPKFGDVLYCNIGSDLGAAAIVDVDSDFLITWNVLRIVSNTKIISPKFFSYLLNHNRKELRKSATESTMPFISSKALAKYVFLIPKLDEQLEIISVLESLDERIIKIIVKIDQYKSLKKALMQDLLTGKVRVKLDS